LGSTSYLNNINNHRKFRTNTAKVVSFIERDDIRGLILQQEAGFGKSMRPPIALYMDSFSELTDQSFNHRKQNWYFCANYSDVIHSKEFERKFESLGLISVENLQEQYRLFFNLFRQHNESVPIIFMHFPVKLDKRAKFHLRYQRIKEAIDKLKTEFQPFYSFTVDEEIIDWPEELIPGLDNFPYHYNKATYQDLADQIKAISVFD